MSVCRIRLSFSWSGKKKGMHSTTYTLPCVIPYSKTKIHSVLDFKKNKSLKQTLHNRKFKTFFFICQDLFSNFRFLKILVFWGFFIILSCDIISFFCICMHTYTSHNFIFRCFSSVFFTFIHFSFL